ncbi:MAG: sensor histidine kinase [Caenispirillum sp.]|nr:sensor histidine kinase [Caenispirillum sp.]
MATLEQLVARQKVLVENICKLHDDVAAVRVETRFDDADLSPDLAVPLGLIVNEFVTNSLKHAFDGRGGTILVSGERVADDRLHLHLRDDGKGLTRTNDGAPAAETGTGLKLIRDLARQIDADAQWSTGQGGTQLTLDLPRAYRS